MKKRSLLLIFNLIAFVFLIVFVGRALAGRGNAAHASSASNNDPIYCSGTGCDSYKAAATHCTDNLQLLDDIPIYDSQSQAGSLRFWYSSACQTFWTQIFSTDCTNIDQFQAWVSYSGSQAPTINDSGLEGGCSLSSQMLYSTASVQAGGAIHFTDGRGWVFAPPTGVTGTTSPSSNPAGSAGETTNIISPPTTPAGSTAEPTNTSPLSPAGSTSEPTNTTSSSSSSGSSEPTTPPPPPSSSGGETQQN
jgi:hypothetical protein